MIRKKLTRTIKKLCNDFHADYSLVDTKTRKREIITVRHLIFYFVKEGSKLSWSEIGGIFNQDHANALLAHKSISNLLETDLKLIEWFRINEIQVRQMIESAIYGNNILIKKKYRHYEIVEMVSRFFGESEAERFEKYIVNEMIKDHG